MWTTVLALALALNLEPFRVGLVPLMISRPRPSLQLLAFLCGGLAMAIGAGLLVLFVFDRSPLGSDPADGARAQLWVGVIALVVAAVMAAWPAATASPDSPPSKTMVRVREVLRRGSSPWWAGAIGLGTGLPSVDYLAVLLVIGSAGAPPAMQVTALLAFLLVGNAVVWIPLLGLLVAPQRAGALVESFRRWIQTRTRRQFAGLVAALGVILVAVGLGGL